MRRFLGRFILVLVIVSVSLVLPFTKFVGLKNTFAVKNATSTTQVNARDVAGTSFSNAENSATGAVFLGVRFRTYNGNFLFQDDSVDVQRNSAIPLSYPSRMPNTTCSKWSVLTTIAAPTLAVTTASQLEDWCLVIVADRKTPDNYLDAPELQNRNNVFFLSVALQDKYAKDRTVLGNFVRSTPYNHFARKNLGYLFAIQRGATLIFDFDDDNILKSVNGTITPPLTNDNQLENADIALVTTKVFNPYPLMGATVPSSWPRGFPLESIKELRTQGSVAYSHATLDMEQIAIMQICADENPDIDAIHRLTRPLPMFFGGLESQGNALISPAHAFVPYNAQATVHAAHAFWAMLLPTTVPGRVSDIWRSYFAECLFRDLDLRVAFLPPVVVQDRNVHNIIGDMKAEEDLYYKTEQLLEFLDSWTDPARSLPTRMERLWITLYERGYIELRDVQLVQLWLSSLLQSGYSFPVIATGRNHHVVIMGQFNYAIELPSIQFWVQKWREKFQEVVVRGPFPEDLLDELQSHGINARLGLDDKGYVSPMKNMVQTLQEFQHVEGIDAVLYIHDDAIPRLLSLSKYPFSTNVVQLLRFQKDWIQISPLHQILSLIQMELPFVMVVYLTLHKPSWRS